MRRLMMISLWLLLVLASPVEGRRAKRSGISKIEGGSMEASAMESSATAEMQAIPYPPHFDPLFGYRWNKLHTGFVILLPSLLFVYMFVLGYTTAPLSLWFGENKGGDTTPMTLPPREGEEPRPIQEGIAPDQPDMLRELKFIVKISIPGAVTVGLMMVNETTNLLFLGQVGSTSQIAAVGLGNLIQNCIAMYVGYGICAAMDTLVSQATGAGHHEKCAYLLQRCRVVICLNLIWMLPILWWSKEILVFLGQNPVVATNASHYNKMSGFGIFGCLQGFANQTFLRNRKILLIPMAIQALTSLLHILWCYIYVFTLRWANFGCGCANVTTWNLTFVLTHLYLAYVAPTTGLSRYSLLWLEAEGFKEIIPYLHVAIPTAMQMSCKLWYYECVSLFAGFLGTIQLAAHTSVMNFVFIYQIPGTGLNFGCATVIGNTLGEGRPKTAKATWALGLGIGLIFFIITGALLLQFRTFVAAAYTDDMMVQPLIASVLIVVAAAQLGDTSQLTLAGCLRGGGLQKVAAVGFLVSLWLIALPTMLFLSFYWGLGVHGLWMATMIGNACAAVLFVTVLYFQDWRILATAALERLRSGKKDIIVACH